MLINGFGVFTGSDDTQEHKQVLSYMAHYGNAGEMVHDAMRNKTVCMRECSRHDAVTQNDPTIGTLAAKEVEMLWQKTVPKLGHNTLVNRSLKRLQSDVAYARRVRNTVLLTLNESLLKHYTWAHRSLDCYWCYSANFQAYYLKYADRRIYETVPNSIHGLSDYVVCYITPECIDPIGVDHGVTGLQDAADTINSKVLDSVHAVLAEIEPQYHGPDAGYF